MDAELEGGGDDTEDMDHSDYVKHVSGEYDFHEHGASRKVLSL